MNKYDNIYKDPNSNEALSRYRDRLIQFDFSPETLGWREGTQEIRFQAFIDGFGQLPPKSILDVGCGFGDLLRYLRRTGWEGSYIGIDLVPEFINQAKSTFSGEASSGIEFLCCDFLDFTDTIQFDATFASGILNHRRTDNNFEQYKRIIDKFKKITREYSALDFLSSTSDRRRPDLFFFDPSEVLRSAIEYTKRVSVDHSYMPFEFMLKMYWNDSFRSDWPFFSEDQGYE